MKTYLFSFLNGLVIFAFVWLIDPIEVMAGLEVPIFLGCGLLGVACSIALTKYSASVLRWTDSSVYGNVFSFVYSPLMVFVWPVLVVAMLPAVQLTLSNLLSMFGVAGFVVVAVFFYRGIQSVAENDEVVIDQSDIPMWNRPPKRRIDLVPTDMIFLFAFVVPVFLATSSS